MLGFKLKRSPEEQKAFEERVERMAFDSTVKFLCWLKLDKLFAGLQTRSAKHPKVWLGVMSLLMVLMFVLLVRMPNPAADYENSHPLQDALEQVKAARRSVGNLNVFADSMKIVNRDTLLHSDTGAGIRPYPPTGTPAQ